MSFIERHPGCEPSECFFSSPGPYYTVFDHELFSQFPHMEIALGVGAVSFTILFILKRKQKLNLPWWLIIILVALDVIIVFLLLVYFAPYIVQY